MTELDLLRIVETLTNPRDDITGDALQQLTDQFVDSIAHPGGSDLLYYPEYWGLPPNPSPQEIVQEALSWNPRVLTMPVSYVRPHPKQPGLFCYGVGSPGTIQTQIVSPLKFKVGDVCVVALSGVRLGNGTEVKHGFLDGAYTAGEILGLTDKPAGVELGLDDY